jgi:hypothetical protein
MSSTSGGTGWSAGSASGATAGRSGSAGGGGGAAGAVGAGAASGAGAGAAGSGAGAGAGVGVGAVPGAGAGAGAGAVPGAGVGVGAGAGGAGGTGTCADAAFASASTPTGINENRHLDFERIAFALYFRFADFAREISIPLATGSLGGPMDAMVRLKPEPECSPSRRHSRRRVHRWRERRRLSPGCDRNRNGLRLQRVRGASPSPSPLGRRIVRPTPWHYDCLGPTRDVAEGEVSGHPLARGVASGLRW